MPGSCVRSGSDSGGTEKSYSPWTRNTMRLVTSAFNFEQVVAAAPLVVELLTSCPKVKALVTSRMVLRVQGEYDFSVPPLSLPDLTQLPGIEALPHYAAVALFLQRAQRS